MKPAYHIQERRCSYCITGTQIRISRTLLDRIIYQLTFHRFCCRRYQCQSCKQENVTGRKKEFTPRPDRHELRTSARQFARVLNS